MLQYIASTYSTSVYLQLDRVAKYMRLRELSLVLLTELAAKPFGTEETSSQLALVHLDCTLLY